MKKMLEDIKLSNIHASKELILYNGSSFQRPYTESMQTQSKSQGYSSSTYKKQSEIYMETQKTMISQRKDEEKDKCYRYHHPKLCKRVTLLKYIHHGSHTQTCTYTIKPTNVIGIKKVPGCKPIQLYMIEILKYT